MERTIDRRTVMQAGWVAALGTGAAAAMPTGETETVTAGAPPLRDKFFGCVAGVYVRRSHVEGLNDPRPHRSIRWR